MAFILTTITFAIYLALSNGCSRVDQTPVDVCVMDWIKTANIPYTEWRFTCKDGKAYQQIWRSNTTTNCDPTLPYREHHMNTVPHVCDGSAPCPYVYYETTMGDGIKCGVDVNSKKGAAFVVGTCIPEGSGAHAISESIACNSTAYTVTQYPMGQNCTGNANGNTIGPTCKTTHAAWTMGHVTYCGQSTHKQ
eukprot:956757_1